MFMDGTIDGGTAWLHQPDCHGESTASYWRDPDDYSEAVRFFDAAGVPTATHATGDAAVTHVLDSVEALGGGRARHRIEHIETLPAAQLGRFAQLDVVASMQPTHATEYTRADHSDNWSRRLGDERADQGWRCRDLLDAGACVTLGSDWPVAPFDPREIMSVAQTRRPLARPELPPVAPQQGLTAMEALLGYTAAPAYAAGHEAIAGRVAPGRRADLTVFGADPTAVTPSDLASLPVHLTVVDGRVRHRAE
jgi:predicted amidohydrolase YtcJ